MPCACGGNKAKGAGVEYEVRFRDGSSKRVPDIPTARNEIRAKGGGTYRPVSKSRAS